MRCLTKNAVVTILCCMVFKKEIGIKEPISFATSLKEFKPKLSTHRGIEITHFKL